MNSELDSHEIIFYLLSQYVYRRLSLGKIESIHFISQCYDFIKPYTFTELNNCYQFKLQNFVIYHKCE